MLARLCFSLSLAGEEEIPLPFYVLTRLTVKLTSDRLTEEDQTKV